MKIIHIHGRGFDAGVVCNKANIVVEVAPIVKWMKGWSLQQVIDYCKARSWDYDITEEPPK